MARQEPLQFGGSGLGLLELGALFVRHLVPERGAHLCQQLARRGVELAAIRVVVVLGNRKAAAPAALDHQLERGHFGRLLDSLAQLGLDALGERPGVAVLVGKGAAHEDRSMRARPGARGSGVMCRSWKNSEGSPRLSAWSMAIWSDVMG